jgi:hypothetical protein
MMSCEQAQTSAAMQKSASAASELLQTASSTSGWTPAALTMSIQSYCLAELWVIAARKTGVEVSNESLIP